MQRFVIILFWATMMMISACEKSATDLCGGEQPEKNLSWLKSKTNILASSPDCNSVSRSTYKNQTVFIIANCEPNVNSIPSLFDCEGRQLVLTDEDYRNLNFTGPIELIWKNK